LTRRGERALVRVSGCAGSRPGAGRLAGPGRARHASGPPRRRPSGAARVPARVRRPTPFAVPRRAWAL